MSNQSVAFMKYVGDNFTALKKALKGSYNEDLFNDTIIRVYETIEKKPDLVIRDFGFYFKRAYYTVYLQNEYKKKKESEIFIDADYSDELYNDIANGKSYDEIEDLYQYYDRTFYSIVKYVFENYEPMENEIWRMKRLNKLTYKAIEDITGVNFYKLQKTVSKIDSDLKNNFDINSYYNDEL